MAEKLESEEEDRIKAKKKAAKVAAMMGSGKIPRVPSTEVFEYAFLHVCIYLYVYINMYP
jgi:hypothetical protein